MSQPREPAQRNPAASAAALAALGLCVVLAVLVYRVPPDGREHGSWGEFIGRLHPLLVHGPVALLALVPFMELAGRALKRDFLAPAAGWILAIAVAATLVTAFDGWLLAWSGGYRGRDVTLHMWSGIWLASASAAALWARARGAGGLYRLLLVAAFVLVVWTGHLGGAISHGDGYLTDKMPPALRTWFGMPAPEQPAPAAPTTSAHAAIGHAGPAGADPSNPAFFAIHVAPILQRSCIPCHRPEKHKGGLRMDTYEQLMKGGDDGPVVAPGDPKSSDLLRRVRLPLSDDDSMPSDGEKILTPEEIQTIERWIAAGAKSG